MVKSSLRTFFLWTFMVVALVAQQVDSKGHHRGNQAARHPKRHHDLHRKSGGHSQAIRNKRSELSTIEPNLSNFFGNKSDKSSGSICEKSLTDLEKLFGPIPQELHDHVRVKRNNFNNYLTPGASASASSEYLKKLADSFAGPAKVQNDEDNLDDEFKNDKQLEDVRRKREVDEEEITNFFPENSRVVNLIRTKRYGDPDKRVHFKRKRTNKSEKNIIHKGNNKQVGRLKRKGKSKIKSNTHSKDKKNYIVKKSIKRKNKSKLKLKRCSKNNKDKKKHDKDDKSKARFKRRPEESGGRPESSLEEIRDLAANLVSKVDELEGSIKINRRSGRNPHGYASGVISNSMRHRILGARHSASDLSNSSEKFKMRPFSRRRRRRRKKNRRKMRRRMNRNRNRKRKNKRFKCKKRVMENKKWARWTDWSSCSVTCGRGRQIRWRHCKRNCKNAETEMEEKTCQLPACAPARLFGIF